MTAENLTNAWMIVLNGLKNAMEKDNDMERKDTYVDNLLISLIEQWNDEHMKSKLSPDLICIIRTHLDHAYSVGMERTFRKINREFNKYKANTKVSHALMTRIIDQRTYKL